MKTLLLGAAAAVIMSGCTIERTVVQEPEPTTTTEAPTPTTEKPEPAYELDTEDMFIDVILQAYGPLPVSREEVIKSGWMICDGLDSGISQAEVEQIIIDSAGSDDSLLFLASIFASAVIWLCPQHAWMMDSYQT